LDNHVVWISGIISYIDGLRIVDRILKCEHDWIIWTQTRSWSLRGSVDDTRMDRRVDNRTIGRGFDNRVDRRVDNRVDRRVDRRVDNRVDRRGGDRRGGDRRGP